jgi:hypothetical protein
MSEVTEIISDLGMSVSVQPRHLPCHVRFESRVVAKNGLAVRIYNPLSLGSLCSSLIVANTEKETLKRFEFL